MSKDTSGPAFPCQIHNKGDVEVKGFIGESIAPNEVMIYEGASMREYAAIEAMQGLLAGRNSDRGMMDYAETAVEIADAIRARSAKPQQLSGWHRAADEEMVLTHLGVADPSDSYETAKKKLNDLIAWHVAVATDPAVNGGYVLVRQDSATIPSSSTTE